MGGEGLLVSSEDCRIRVNSEAMYASWRYAKLNPSVREAMCSGTAGVVAAAGLEASLELGKVVGQLLVVSRMSMRVKGNVGRRGEGRGEREAKALPPIFAVPYAFFE